jgi:acyl dehydratase
LPDRSDRDRAGTPLTAAPLPVSPAPRDLRSHTGRRDDPPTSRHHYNGCMTAGRFATIDEEALRSLHARVGRAVRRPEPYIEVATRDAIRHWSDGIGDRNPCWLRLGIAPPTILFAMDRIVSGYVGGLPGIHAMYGGTDFHWYLPIREGDRIVGESLLLELMEKPSTFARRAIQQTYRTSFRNQHGAMVCQADSWCFRTERDTARERGKYRNTERARHTPEEIERIRRSYREEQIRGETPRYAEDVSVGETLSEICKGPLTVTSVIAFVQGWGSLYVRAHGRAFDLFERHPALGISNEFGAPEPPERVHWSEEFARAVGVPGAYDYGPERVAWLGHVVTNWMGDGGELRRLRAEVRRHNLIGDVTWCRGVVTGKRTDGPAGLVDIELSAVNQRDETTARGTATVALPRRSR